MWLLLFRRSMWDVECSALFWIQSMSILLNGEKTETQGAANVAELVERFQLSPQTVLIEHNGFALHRNEWSKHRLAEGDRVELIRVVAGG